MPEILSPKALREKRAPLGKRINELREKIAAENRDFTAEERKNWEDVNKEYDGLTLQIQVADRADQVTRELESPVGTPPVDPTYNGRDEQKKLTKEQRRDAKLARRQVEMAAERFQRMGWLAPKGSDGKTDITEEHRCLALQGWARVQSGRGLRPEHEHACRLTGLNPRRKYLDLNLRSDYGRMLKELRAQSVNVMTAGGYTVPEGFVNNLEVALLAYGNPRQFADVMRTASGQDLPWPTVNDTGIKGSIIGENATLSATSKAGDVAMGLVTLKAYKYTSTPAGGAPVFVPAELMEDSAFDLASTIGELLGIRIGRKQADDFTTGTGAGQPTGYVTAATLGRTAAAATAISTDDLIQLKHSVDPAYRNGAAFVMHDQILMQVKLLKDGTGRPLWQSSFAGGRPDTIDGDPLFINQSMDSTLATGKKTVAYGALKKYKIREVSQVRLRRLVERYADSDQEAFVMFMRADANLLDAGTHPIKYIVH